MFTFIHHLPFALVILVFYAYCFGCRAQSVREFNNTINQTLEEIHTDDGKTISITTTVEETHVEDVIGEKILKNEFINALKKSKGSNKTTSTVTNHRVTNSNVQTIKEKTTGKVFGEVKASCVANSDSIQSLTLPGWPTFTVRCITDVNGKCPWAVILERKSANDNFDFGWQQYRKGFGDPATGNGYFVGLQNLRALTQYQMQELYISKRFEREDLLKETYVNFLIGDESIDFAVLSLSVVTNNTMVRHLQLASKFSTKDRHFDERLAVCPTNLRMGWWYSEKCLQ